MMNASQFHEELQLQQPSSGSFIPPVSQQVSPRPTGSSIPPATEQVQPPRPTGSSVPSTSQSSIESAQCCYRRLQWYEVNISEY
ncbi:hypothetical protein EMCRGX_G002218 [Ephydatia muelleri]